MTATTKKLGRATLPASAATASNQRTAAASPRARGEDGQPLGASIRSHFESRFGHDFSRVRVHTRDDAVRAADAIGASAFTVGEDIHLAAAQYQPETPRGRRLIAHELAHTVQQSAATDVQARAEPLAADAMPERAAEEAAERVSRGERVTALAPSPLAVARQGKAQPPGISGHLRSDPNWSYIVYDDEVRLRYFRDLPKEEAAKRAKKHLPGFVQVGTIPWVTKNPGNITQTPGAATSTLQGYPADLGSLGTYGGRYAIFPTTGAGIEAIGGYLRKLPSFGTAPNLSMAETIKQYKGEEPSEKAAREAREKENKERAAKGQAPLPEIDVRKKYLEDVKATMRKRIVAAEALEGGEEVEDLSAGQRKELDALASDRIRQFMATPAKDVAAGDPDLVHAVQGIYEAEGRAAAPGVTFTLSGFDDPTGKAPFDGEQKALIKKLVDSQAAKDELRALLGGGKP